MFITVIRESITCKCFQQSDFSNLRDPKKDANLNADRSRESCNFIILLYALHRI